MSPVPQGCTQALRCHFPSITNDTYFDRHVLVGSHHGAIPEVFAGQVAVGQRPHEREGREWQLGDHLPVKPGRSSNDCSALDSVAYQDRVGPGVDKRELQVSSIGGRSRI
jgi:hypothetical protein